MTQSTLSCPNCEAPVTPSRTSATLRCAYCDHYFDNPHLSPAPTHQVSRSGRSSAVLWILLSTGAIIFVSVIATVIFMVSSSSDDSSLTQGQEEQIAKLNEQIDELASQGSAEAEIQRHMERIKKKAEQDNREEIQSMVDAVSTSNQTDSASNPQSPASKGAKKQRRKPAPAKEPAPVAEENNSTPGGYENVADAPGNSAATDHSSTPENLTRKQIFSGMGAVSGAVKRCGAGQTGTFKLKVTIEPDGHISEATSVGPFAGTPAGACAARAVRRARFPKTTSALTVTFPFDP